MRPEIPDDCRRILARVGLALIIFGAMDIGVMAYCIAHQVSYSSSFNVFAVISGVYVWKGHPWYVRWVTRAAAFYIAGFSAIALLVFPVIFPPGLAVAEFRLHPWQIVGGTAAGVGVITFLIWVYRQLRAPPVLAAYEHGGHYPRAPWPAFALGTTLAVAGGIAATLSLHGDGARRAIELAKARTGDGYRYSVSSLSWAGDHGRAQVMARLGGLREQKGLRTVTARGIRAAPRQRR